MQSEYKDNFGKNQQDTGAWINMERKSRQSMNSDLTFDPSLHQNLSKKRSSFHLPCLIGTFLLYSSLIITLLQIHKFQDSLTTIYINMLIYSIYLICSVPCGDIIGIINNLKSYEQYKQLHEKLIQAKGYFLFSAKCFHFENSKFQAQTQKRIISRSQSQRCDCKQSFDESGRLINEYEVKDYGFIQYTYNYQFSTQQSKDRLLKKFKEFKGKYTDDEHQEYGCTFKIDGLESRVSFCSSKTKFNQKILFLVTGFLGLALFYACIFERLVTRYQIKLKKKLIY